MVQLLTTRARYLNGTDYYNAVIRDWRNDPEQAALNNELHNVLESGLMQLVPDLRTAVMLRDIQGFSNQRAAETLQVCVECLKSRLHRGRVFLRKYLKEYLTGSHV